MGIPHKERSSCREFVDLATKLDKKSPPDPEQLEAAYVAAVDEARKLVARGLLTLELPDEGSGDAKNPGTEASPTPRSLQKYDIHPTASIFPMMSDEALDELTNDIKEHGLRDPSVLHEGRVIDGRNRLEGCHRAGVEPTFEAWSGTGSVVAWIISVNVHRRHLTDQQRAMIAASVAQELAAEANDRSARNLRNSGDPVDGLDPTYRGEGRSTERAAKLMNVSSDAAKKGAKIANSGSEELVNAVTDGKVSLDAAATIANLPEAKQREVVAKGKVQETAKKIREQKAVSKSKSKPAPQPQPAADKDEPRGEPPATKDEEEPAADTEPPEPAAEDADEEEVDENTTQCDPDGVPLLREAHKAIDEMVRAGRAAQELDKVEVLRGKVIEFCNGYTSKFEEIAMP